MPQPIFLRVGTEDRVTLQTFVEVLGNFLRALKDLDATITGDPLGSVRWEIDTLSKKSPPVISVSPVVRNKRVADNGAAVAMHFIESTRTLARKAERDEKYVSDSALDRIERLAKKATVIGPLAAWLPKNGAPKIESQISRTTLRNVQQLTGVKYSSFGTITGNLQAISVHRGEEFRIWDSQTNKPIRCTYSPDVEQTIKDSLRKDVAVIGTILMNSAGNPISVEVEEVEPIGAASGSDVTAEELSGAVKDFTGGRSLREYFEELDED